MLHPKQARPHAPLYVVLHSAFRWKDVRETQDTVEMALRLTTPSELKTRFTIPAAAMADVTLRRLQVLRVAPGESVHWTFGAASGAVQADTAGYITIPRLKITAEPATLGVRTAK